jgi:polysaccharide pyruvyl transferase WcaK-like protein
MKVLLINSDLAKNRGDRAITEGIIQLIRERFPDAQITGISEQAERDAGWFGIDFLPMDTQSLNPVDLWKLLSQAQRADMVLWGGGELLKDYTNKAALWYWVGKLWLVSLANKNLYGAYQGIGPTTGAMSKRLIRFIVNRCYLFAVRDQESYDKLLAWGCSGDRVLPASDPAILPSPAKLSGPTRQQLADDFDIDARFLKNFVAIGPRDWFHYRPGGLIPYKYKKKLGLVGRPDPKAIKKHKHTSYLKSLTAVCETVLQKNHYLLLIPMHMGEEDIALCRDLRGRLSQPEKVRILDRDTLSPADLRSVMAYAQGMVGFRLHSTIIATSSFVPSINYYYVDKGRVYFDQIGQRDRAFPIEYLLATNFHQKFDEEFIKLTKDKQHTSQMIRKNIHGLRKVIQDTFDTMMHRYE